jgi:hypothetical protein
VLVATAQALLTASLADLLSFLTPERIALEASRTFEADVSAGTVRYQFRNLTTGARIFDRNRLIDAMIAMMTTSYRIANPGLSPVPREPFSRVASFIAADLATAGPAEAGLERLRVLTAVADRGSNGRHRWALHTVEHRLDQIVRSTFRDVAVSDRDWYAACVPLALDALMIARLLRAEEPEFRRLAESTAGIVASWAGHLPPELGFPAVPAPPNCPGPGQHRGPSAQREAVLTREALAAAALAVLGQANLSDLLAFLTPTSISVRSGGAVSRLQVARTLSEDRNGAFSIAQCVGEMLGLHGSCWRSLSADSVSPHISDDAWRSGLHDRSMGEGRTVVAEVLCWLSIAVARSDDAALAAIAGPMSADLEASIGALSSATDELRYQLWANAVLRETLLLWVGRLRRWCAPWEGPSSVAWLVAAGSLIETDIEARRAVIRRPFALGALTRASFASEVSACACEGS